MGVEAMGYGTFATLTAASFVLDLIAGAPLAHQLADITGAAAVFALAY